MGALIRPFVLICLLRVRPQDLPASWTLLAVTIATHSLMSVLLSSINLRIGHAVLAGLTETALLCALTGSLLLLQRIRERTVQTLSALAGSDTVIGFIALPVGTWLRQVNLVGDSTVAPALLLLALIAWSLVVSAHILRHALSTSFFLGLVVAVAFYWMSIQVLNNMFPIAA